MASLDGQMDREQIEGAPSPRVRLGWEGEKGSAGIIVGQKEALARFEKTNEMLGQCAALSATRLEAAKKDLDAHAKLIREVKVAPSLLLPLPCSVNLEAAV